MKLRSTSCECSYTKVILLIFSWLLLVCSFCSLALGLVLAMYPHSSTPSMPFFQVLDKIPDAHKISNLLFLPLLLYGIVKNKPKFCIPWLTYCLAAVPFFLNSVWLTLKVYLMQQDDDYDYYEDGYMIYDLVKEDLLKQIAVNVNFFLIYVAMFFLLKNNYEHLKKMKSAPKEIVPPYMEPYAENSAEKFEEAYVKQPQELTLDPDTEKKLNFNITNEKGDASEC